MTEDEARAALSARGWTLHIRKRRARQFAYAARRDGNTVQERYLAALDAPELPAVITALPNMRAAHEDQDSGQAQPTARELASLSRRMPNFAEILHKAACEGRITGYTPPTKIIWPAGGIYTHLAGGDVLRGGDLAREVRRELGQSEWLLSPLEQLVFPVRPGDKPDTCMPLAKLIDLLRPYLSEAKSKPVAQSLFEALPNRQQLLASNVAQPAPAKTPRIAPQQNRPAPVQPMPAEQPPRKIAPPVAQPAKADRRLSPAGTIRAHLRVLGWKSDYREVWFALDDTTSCKIPGGQALWNDWCEDMPEEVIRKAVTEMEKRLDIPALLIWKE
jgi:hypothetical protein